MSKPLFVLYSQVKNNVSNGLRGATANQNYTEEQVMDDLLQTRAALWKEYTAKGVTLSKRPFQQTLGRVPVRTKDFGQATVSERGRRSDPMLEAGLPLEILQQYVQLPPLLTPDFTSGHQAIEFLGAPAQRLPLRLLYGNDYLYTQYERYTGREPFAWINGQDCWLFAATPLPHSHLVLRAALSDPREANEYGGWHNFEEDPFPIPDDFVNTIVERVTNKYISMYGRLNVQPNTGNGPL